jgi:outer membrane protein assembly factor BamB
LVKKWTAAFPGNLGYPIIAEGRVFVLSGGINGGNGAELFALDQASGKQLWHAFIDTMYQWAALTYGDGRLYCLGNGGGLTAYAPDTGKILWSKQMPGQRFFTAPPTFLDGNLYVGGSGNSGTLYAVRAANGKVLWTQSVANGDASAPAVSGGYVYVGYAGNQVSSFRAATGAMRWHYSMGLSGGGGKSTVLSPNSLYTRDFFGNLVLNLKTGLKVRTHLSTVAPAVYSGTLVSVTNKLLHAANEADGAEIWTFTLNKSIVTAPLVVNGYVIVGSGGGSLFAVRRLDGGILWRGDVGFPILGPDEQNVSQPITGLAAGDGLILVPAGKNLIAYVSGK